MPRWNAARHTASLVIPDTLLLQYMYIRNPHLLCTLDESGATWHINNLGQWSLDHFVVRGTRDSIVDHHCSS